MGWVFGHPSFEIAARVRSPFVALVGARGPDPLPGNYVEGIVTLRMFFQGFAEDLAGPVF